MTPDAFNMLEHALKYAASGKPVFPCWERDETEAEYQARLSNMPEGKRKDAKRWEAKNPRVAGGFKAATTDESKIRFWWARWPDASIGCPTGPAIGAWVLDVDLPKAPGEPDGRDTLTRLEATHGGLPATVTQRTGSGGEQRFFRWLPDGPEIKNTSGKIGPKLDTRGAGGFVILPPSLHPAGNRYAWTSNGAELAEAPAWLIELVLAKPAQAPRVERPNPTRTATGYGRAALEAEASKVAAAPGGQRNETLNAAAYSLGQLVAGGVLDQGEVESALLDAANAAGLTDGEARATIRSGMTAGEREPRTAPEPAKAGGGQRTEAPGDAPRRPDSCRPVSFDDCAPPPILPDMLPGILRAFPLALAEAIQIPYELALINALGAVAVAAQRKFRVMVKPGYAEPINLYALCALPPGERKSSTVEACKRPLVEWQASKRQEMRDEIRDAESERKTMEKAIEAKRAKAAAVTDEGRRDMIEEIKRMERALPEVPVPPRLLADDATPEALAALLERQDERIGMLEAEGGFFDTLAGRYSSGVPNLDLILKGWCGEPAQVDRKGRDAIFLKSPLITLVISPQPEIVQGLASRPGFRGRGLVGRFLYVLPQSRLGGRAIETSPVPTGLVNSWRATLFRLLETSWATGEDGEKTGHGIGLAAEALDLWKQFATIVEAGLLPGGTFEYMSDWGGKFPGQAIRLAGLIHVATSPDPLSPISRQTMSAALSVAAILADHAKTAYGLMGSDPSQECAKAILRWIERDRVDAFTARDALQKVKGRFPTMEKVNPGLTILEERGFIFGESSDQRKGPGRKPSASYTVNPRTWEV